MALASESQAYAGHLQLPLLSLFPTLSVRVTLWDQVLGPQLSSVLSGLRTQRFPH